MEGIGSQVSSGIISNAIFVIIFAVGAWLKSRLGTSHCAANCGILSCDSELIELTQIKEHLHETQRNQTNILNRIVKQIEAEIPLEQILIDIKEPTPI
jgi:hypothetical protein